ncbi:hypothetical protein MRX96_018011 [Rhipicephalus microplus]
MFGDGHQYFVRYVLLTGEIKYRYRERVASAGCSGCDVLLGLTGGAFRRLCWLLVVSLLVGLTLREWARVFGEYHQYGVFTSVHYGTQTSLPFPDVTVCNVKSDSKVGALQGPEAGASRSCARPSLVEGV